MEATQNNNIASVAWSDHVIFGEGDGRLNTLPALRRRMQSWKTDLGARIIHWRCTRDRINGKFSQGKGYRHFARSKIQDIQWDDFVEAPKCAHDLGMSIFLYVALFDEGWPLLPKKEREVSYHNKMHCQHVSWQSNFSKNNPQYTLSDKTQENHQWGVLCLSYPEVRGHFIRRFKGLLASGDFDGLFICLRSQSRPADFADQFGFNRPVRDDFLARFGKDIWTEDFDLSRWQDLQGDYLTLFLTEMRESLNKSDHMLAVGAPRGHILGPPLGNTTFQWKSWVERGIVDQLIIDQNSSKCPSMWHDLWPMHRGYGYIQNYLNGSNMNSLEADLTSVYQPIFCRQVTKLYLARQWHHRAIDKEQVLLEHPCVDGLVFSTFRHDNPGPIRRNNWTA
jgi:hypothetical protein